MTKLRVIWNVLRGKGVCYRASFASDISFTNNVIPELVECSFFCPLENTWIRVYGFGADKGEWRWQSK